MRLKTNPTGLLGTSDFVRNCPSECSIPMNLMMIPISYISVVIAVPLNLIPSLKFSRATVTMEMLDRGVVGSRGGAGYLGNEKFSIM